MRILLVKPRGSAGSRKNHLLNFKERMLVDGFSLKNIYLIPSLGLLTIAAMIPAEHEVRYHDEDMDDDLVPTASWDLALISAMTYQAERAYELGDALRALGVYTVVGGVHPSLLPDEAAAHFDTVFVKEAENTFPRFLADLAAGRPGARYAETATIEMTASPVPRFELLGHGRYPIVPVQVTRGCPYTCDFCSAIGVMGNKFRYKSVDQVVTEVRAIREITGTSNLFFTDDNLFIHRKFSHDLLDGLRGEGIRWMTHSDIAISEHPDLLLKIREAGCFRLLVGIESIVKENLDASAKWKASWHSRYGPAVDKIQEAGIGVFAGFIVGFDHDTDETFDLILAFLREHAVFEINLSILTPYPETPLGRRMDAEGRITSRRYGEYDTRHLTFTPARISSERLMERVHRLIEAFESPEMIHGRIRRFKEIALRLREPVVAEALELAVMPS